MGFSDGGHLAASAGTLFDTPNNFKEQPLDTISAKPNFMMLIYPVISTQDKYAHKGSQNNLLGINASENLKIKFSNELNVTQNTPPTFLAHSADDKAAPVENSLDFYKALHNKDIPAEMHIYPKVDMDMHLQLTKAEYPLGLIDCMIGYKVYSLILFKD
ncbi:prolyl oligopeptidase family serine peptidase [Polaribacter sp. SA4-12]|uniref:alpha/beta hydrolase n=1 Tax=Polaribacter sp. SA4-12 TaxID=1312072 RepID=UPI000B3C6C7E